MMGPSFFQQRLHNIRLTKIYLPESFTVKILGMEDKEGNPIALYESDYVKLKKYLAVHGETITEFDALSKTEKLRVLANAKVKVIKYFSPDELAKHHLDLASLGGPDAFTRDSEIFDVAGNPLLKEGHQNCVVRLENGTVAIHPKVRSQIGDLSHEFRSDVDSSKSAVAAEETVQGRIGVSHSSLSAGKAVAFAGSFTFDAEKGWILDNATGHFGTSAYQMNEFLRELSAKGVNLKNLTIRIWIPKTKAPKVDADYDIRFENAAEFLSRTSASINASAKRKETQTQLVEETTVLLRESTQLDSSEFILFTMEIIAAKLGKALNPEVSTFLKEVKITYVTDPSEAVNKLRAFSDVHKDELGIDLNEIIQNAAEKIRDLPEKGQTRRYFETLIAETLSTEQLDRVFLEATQYSKYLCAQRGMAEEIEQERHFSKGSRPSSAG